MNNPGTPEARIAGCICKGKKDDGIIRVDHDCPLHYFMVDSCLNYEDLNTSKVASKVALTEPDRFSKSLKAIKAQSEARTRTAQAMKDIAQALRGKDSLNISFRPSRDEEVRIKVETELMVSREEFIEIIDFLKKETLDHGAFISGTESEARRMAGLDKVNPGDLQDLLWREQQINDELASLAELRKTTMQKYQTFSCENNHLAYAYIPVIENLGIEPCKCSVCGGTMKPLDTEEE